MVVVVVVSCAFVVAANEGRFCFPVSSCTIIEPLRPSPCVDGQTCPEVDYLVTVVC